MTALDIRPLLTGLDGSGVPFESGGRTLAGMDCWGVQEWIQERLGREMPPVRWDGAYNFEREKAGQLDHEGRWTWSEVPDGSRLCVGDVALTRYRGHPHVATVYQEMPCRFVTAFLDGQVLTHPMRPSMRRAEFWRLGLRDEP